MIHAYFTKSHGPNCESGVALCYIQSLDEWEADSGEFTNTTDIRKRFEQQGCTHFTPRIDWWPDEQSFYAGLPGAATITCHDLQIIVHEGYASALEAWEKSR